MNRQYGFIIGYRLEGKTPVERTRFNRRFLGYTDKSQYGKFSDYNPKVLIFVFEIRIFVFV